MRKIFVSRLALGVLGLAVLSGSASAQVLRAPVDALSAGVATGAYAAGDVVRTGAIVPQALGAGVAPGFVREDADALEGTLHLFGPRTDARPY